MNCVFQSAGALCIWLPNAGKVNQYADFIHDFRIGSPSPDAKLYLSADTEYAAFLNGHFIGCGQYDDYPENRAFDVYPVGQYLVSGENRITIAAYYQGEDSMQYVTGSPMIIYALESGNAFPCVSGTDTLCREDPAYLSGPGLDRLTFQLSFSFLYHADKAENWTAPGFVPGDAWSAADVRAGLRESLNFFKRPVKNLEYGPELKVKLQTQGVFRKAGLPDSTLGYRMQTDFLSSRPPEDIFSEYPAIPLYQSRTACFPGKLVSKPEAGDFYFVLDCDREETGLFTLRLSASAGTRIDVSYGEHLHDLRVRSHIDARSFAFTYICADGEQEFTHYFKRIAGRYIALHVSDAAAPVTFRYVGIIPVNYPVSETGTFRCSDRLFNRIHDVCRNTLRLCMHEHYEDSPWREQGLYGMDSRNQMLPGYYLYDNGDYVLANLRLLAQHVRPDGLLQNAAPCSYPTTMPSFSLEWVLSFRDYLLYTGDYDGARSLYPVAEGILGAVAAYFDGTLPAFIDDPTIWQFYEWVDGLDDLDGLVQKRTQLYQYDAPLSALFCLAYDALSEAAGWLNIPFDRFRNVREAIHENFFRIFWDKNRGVFASHLDNGALVGYHELTQAWALEAGLVPKELRIPLCDLLCDPENGLVKSTLSFCLFKYEALLMNPERYAEAVFDDIDRKWGYMLCSGSQSFWETLPGPDDFNLAGSMCHGWNAFPAYIFFRYLLGLNPLKPGFAKYEITPVPLKISAEGSVLTPRGRIRIQTENGCVTKTALSE